jgi:hypothetical protein
MRHKVYSDLTRNRKDFKGKTKPYNADFDGDKIHLVPNREREKRATP